jgi:NTP pyrophosphatase (non-canonical NTP hydrolase)
MTELWHKLNQFQIKYFPGWRATSEVYYSNALAGECGEVCNMVKHRAGGGTNKNNPSDYKLLRELADVFIYLFLLVEYHGHDITSFIRVLDEKIDDNAARMEKILAEGCPRGYP